MKGKLGPGRDQAGTKLGQAKNKYRTSTEQVPNKYRTSTEQVRLLRLEYKTMKAFHDLPLPAPLHDALREVYDRLTTAFRVDRLVLFGSVVRGEADEESDTDLLVVLTERPTRQERDRITGLILDANLKYGTNLSELIVDQETWERGLPSALPIHTEIEAEGIRL